MHAVVVRVTIDPKRQDEAERMLFEEVVPMVKQAPGLVGAHWLRSEDGASGISVIVFDSKESAQQAVDMNPPQAPADSPVQLAGIELHEVVATA